MGVELLPEVERIRAAVCASGLLDPGRPLVVLLSGGRDSVCLLDVAVALRGAGAVRALHVNYGLRAAAEEDERHCVALCGRLGVELSVVRASGAPGPPAAAASEPSSRQGQPPAGGNLQAWARELRYEAASEEARKLDRELGETLIASGHTASDQVETILYRLAASPGRRALLGMPAVDGRLVRPLLTITREQTAAYCEARGLAWREDESNEDERFARVRVRARVVPALRAVHPAAESNVLRTARLLREEAQLLDGLLDAELQGRSEIALERLGELPPALARMVLVRLAEDAVEGYVPQAGERVAELLELGARGGRAELHLGGLACAVLADGVLAVRRLTPEETSMRRRNAPPDGD